MLWHIFWPKAKRSKAAPRKEAGGARARSWKVPRELASKEGGPFMPQTVLLRLEADRGFGTISDTVGVDDFLRSRSK
jgi:hypothetical protein